MDSPRRTRAKEVLRHEADCVNGLVKKLTDAFDAAVDAIINCKGKLIVTGIGKSGLVGRKLVATFNSTGTPAIFLHPAEGLHGDLGLLQKDDLVLAISKSGNLDELERFYPVIERLDLSVISITGNLDSPLAQRSTIALDASVPSEACVLDLAPTASSTAALALGDALAIVVQEERGFSAEDFSLLHPGGTLGRRLTTRIRDLMHSGDDLPVVSADTLVKDMLVEVTDKRLGTALVVDDSGRLLGLFTDGDLRRLVSRGENFLTLKAGEVMTPNPKLIGPEELAEKGLKIMEDYQITALVIVDSDRHPVGMIHIHDILKSKIV
jgi:arabinose-5-phosphate isomerase